MTPKEITSIDHTDYVTVQPFEKKCPPLNISAILKVLLHYNAMSNSKKSGKTYLERHSTGRPHIKQVKQGIFYMPRGYHSCRPGWNYDLRPLGGHNARPWRLKVKRGMRGIGQRRSERSLRHVDEKHNAGDANKACEAGAGV